MNCLLRWTSWLVVFFACICSHAFGAPSDSIKVTFGAESLGSWPENTGVFRCDILFGDELWRRAHILKDAEIGRAIYAISRTHPRMYVLLGVNNPVQTSVLEVTKAIARVKTVISANAATDCVVEINVVPLNLPQDSSEPAEQK